MLEGDGLGRGRVIEWVPGAEPRVVVETGAKLPQFTRRVWTYKQGDAELSVIRRTSSERRTFVVVSVDPGAVALTSSAFHQRLLSGVSNAGGRLVLLGLPPLTPLSGGRQDLPFQHYVELVRRVIAAAGDAPVILEGHSTLAVYVCTAVAALGDSLAGVVLRAPLASLVDMSDTPLGRYFARQFHGEQGAPSAWARRHDPRTLLRSAAVVPPVLLATGALDTRTGAMPAARLWSELQSRPERRRDVWLHGLAWGHDLPSNGAAAELLMREMHSWMTGLGPADGTRAASVASLADASVMRAQSGDDRVHAHLERFVLLQ